VRLTTVAPETSSNLRLPIALQTAGIALNRPISRWTLPALITISASFRILAGTVVPVEGELSDAISLRHAAK
jgi:hypothetical protein